MKWTIGDVDDRRATVILACHLAESQNRSRYYLAATKVIVAIRHSQPSLPALLRTGS